jgi:hypothetical protein
MSVSFDASGDGARPVPRRSARTNASMGLDGARRSAPVGSVGDEGPVRRPRRALLDPADQRRLLHLGQRQVRVGHRHHHCRVRAQDAPHQLALAGAARHDGASAGGQRGERALLRVQAQPALARPVVGAVAGKALVRQDRADVEVEVHLLGHTRHLRRRRAAREAAGKDGGEEQQGRRAPRDARQARDRGAGL